MEIILVGASKKARLVLDFLEQEGRAGSVIGFVDRNPTLWNTTVATKPVLSSLETALASASTQSTAFCICLSERFFADRIQIAAQIAQRGFATASLISTSADISPSAVVTSGAILFPSVRVGMNASVGGCVTIYSGALVEHDCVIADNVEIASRAVLAGGVRVKSNAFIGINATILPNLVIGERATIGGGAVVTKDIEDGAVVVGNPAHVLHAHVR